MVEWDRKCDEHKEFPGCSDPVLKMKKISAKNAKMDHNNLIFNPNPLYAQLKNPYFSS